LDDDNLVEDENMRRAREDPRMTRLRNAVLDAVRRVFEGWSMDASVSDVSPSPIFLVRTQPVPDDE
jgi:hypothetical protein